MIYIESKKKSLTNLRRKHPHAKIIDVTSQGEPPWIKVSPFYPHGGIPIPFSPNHYSYSVEGIWQGLKVFESEDIDISKFQVQNMKGIKRTFKKLGKPLGHRKGVEGVQILDYITARKEIYLRTYAWVLENKVQDIIQLLKAEAEKNDIVLLDFDTNGNIEDVLKPLSHAALIKRYIEKKYPELAVVTFEHSNLDSPPNSNATQKQNSDVKINSNKKVTQHKLW